MASGIINPLTGEAIPDDEIDNLSELCWRQKEIEASIKQKEAELSELKDRLTSISEKQIPDKMDQLGMSMMKLSDGTKVEVKPFYSVKMLDGAFKWLEENGHAGLIKTDVTKSYSRGEREAALKFAAENPGFSFKESVHWQTLTAFAKEIYGNNESLPEDYFSVYRGSRTKLSS